MAKTEVKLKPLLVPNYVLLDTDNMLEVTALSSPKYHIRDLSKETVEELLQDFVKAVWDKHKSKENEITSKRR